ncbi:hypothetical protein P691DRAFT_540331 [Macrolepiota fuliginosa MF-IS2]|uniref:Uncharacterized protein n=1 Tax=Macrolepiota fuliginosa MF-IS2 TaxID=1400762 RepID=A0A9P6C5B3_9AGAR|nr:hypothetical protein P691DRAFT_540331 [Macrolepiota fuliginosa MF-IS2]
MSEQAPSVHSHPEAPALHILSLRPLVWTPKLNDPELKWIQFDYLGFSLKVYLLRIRGGRLVVQVPAQFLDSHCARLRLAKAGFLIYSLSYVALMSGRCLFRLTRCVRLWKLLSCCWAGAARIRRSLCRQGVIPSGGFRPFVLDNGKTCKFSIYEL